MSTATASIVVVVLFALLIGVILQVVIQIIPRFRDIGKGRPVAPSEEDRGTAREFTGAAVERAHEARAQVEAMTRPQQFAILVFYGLIGMLILVIKLSPVQMHWGVFFGSVFGGFVIADFVFWLARTHRIRATPRDPEQTT